MLCPSCGERKARRECPALGKTICPRCCGTKRLSEIACPADCHYLTSAREHPAAVVRRQQQKDVATLLPTLRSLTERQHQLFFVFQTVIAQHKPEGFTRLVDADVADATGTLAARLETAARGVIYDHAPQSLIALGLLRDMEGMLARAREQGATIPEREVAGVLRAIEDGARSTRKSDGGPTSYLETMARLLSVDRPADAPQPESPQPSSLIVP
jgi:hypothetical protein